MVIDEAVSEFQESIDLMPTETEAYLKLTDVYVSMWKFKKANELLAEAIDLVSDRSVIERKQADVASIEKGVLNWSVTSSYAETNFKDGRSPWKDFYLDAVWRIDPYKTLVFGFERYARNGIHDELIRVEYVEKVSKWVYLYASAKVTADPDFREKSAFKLGTNFVTNPLPFGSTVIVAETEQRNYDNGKVYFLTGGVDQYIGDSVIINARLFHVITDTQSFNVWSVKTNWQLTPRLSVNANYGTTTEDTGGRLIRGNSKGVGAEYRLDDRVSVTGNYQKINNESYRANQVTVGLKVKLGPSSSRPRRVVEH
jgi:YaiO family outer membrane protein